MTLCELQENVELNLCSCGCYILDSGMFVSKNLKYYISYNPTKVLYVALPYKLNLKTIHSLVQ